MVQACCCPQLAKYSEGQTELEEIIIIVSVMHCWSYKGNLAFNPVADFSRDYILAAQRKQKMLSSSFLSCQSPTIE